MNKRQNFPKSVKLAAWERSRGKCQSCTAKIIGIPHYDHIVADALGGAAGDDNCQVLCKTCHALKTGKRDVPIIAKAKRVHAKHVGAHGSSSRPMPGTKRSGWKKRMDGNWERRDR